MVVFINTSSKEGKTNNGVLGNRFDVSCLCQRDVRMCVKNTTGILRLGIFGNYSYFKPLYSGKTVPLDRVISVSI